MSYDPKPITLTQVDANAYTGAFEPKPYVVVGDIPVPTPDPTDIDPIIASYLTGLAGYDAGETQTLKNIGGVLTWVTDTP